MKPLEKRLDRAVQKLAIGKRCYYCGTNQNIVHHHLQRRSNKLLRWDLKNLLPVCQKHHFDIHNGQLKEPVVEFERIGLKDYLLRNGLIYKEFLELKKKEFGV